MKIPLCLLVSLFTGSFALAQNIDWSEHYKIYDVSKQRVAPLEDVIKASGQVDILVFGEEHNDSIAHYLELAIFQGIVNLAPQKTALSMEMFDRDVQPVMDEYLNDLIKEKHFKKDARVWSNYRDYRPLVELAKNNKIPVVCANAPSRYANLAGRKGPDFLQALPKSAKNWMAPLPYDTASGAYWEKLTGLNLHAAPSAGNTTPAPIANPMGGFNLVAAQSLWDATMAYSIASFRKKNPSKKVFHVNGRFHSDSRFAVVTQLSTYRPKDRVLVISCFSADDFASPDWNNYAQQGDYVILTNPAVPKTYEQ
jgi:uncharacterized iron-regulated protein